MRSDIQKSFQSLASWCKIIIVLPKMSDYLHLKILKKLNRHKIAYDGVYKV